MVDKYCWAYILHRDRLAVKSGNQENLLEGTSVACQIIGFGDQNSDTRQRIWCRVQDALPLQLYSSVISSRKAWFLGSGLGEPEHEQRIPNNSKKTKSFSSSFCRQTDQLKPKLNHLYVLGVFSKSCPSISNKRVTATVVNGGWAVAHPPILRLPKRSDKVTNDKKIKFITLTYY